MRYMATHRRGVIMTDDYSKDEIFRGLHIQHIKRDLRVWGIKGVVNVYDENMRFICRLNNNKSIA